VKASVVFIVCLVFLAASSLSGGGLALAQEQPIIDTLNLSLWPEYDRPGLLVIYRGQFAADAPLPLPVEFRIPVQAGQPSAVAYIDEQGDPIQQEYEVQTEGDWLVITMELPARGFQLEYYLPFPSTAGNTAETGRRSIPFTYTADYAVTGVNVDVQEPRGVTGFVIDPPAQSAAPEGDGLTYHVATVGPLAQNDSASWTISYERTTPGLSLQAGPAPTASPAVTGRKGMSGWLIALAVVTMLGIGAGSYWIASRSSTPSRSPGLAGRPRAREGAKARAAAGAMFCHQCGTQLRSGAEFCQQCGAAARKTGARA